MGTKQICVAAVSHGSPLTQISSGRFNWEIDEPEAFGGTDTAPSPVEMLLGSVAGCISAIGYLAARELLLPLGRMDIEVRGEIDSGGFLGRSKARAGFQKLEIQIVAEADWKASQRALWERTVLARCPVIDNLRHPAQLSLDCRYKKQEELPQGEAE